MPLISLYGLLVVHDIRSSVTELQDLGVGAVEMAAGCSLQIAGRSQDAAPWPGTRRRSLLLFTVCLHTVHACMHEQGALARYVLLLLPWSLL